MRVCPVCGNEWIREERSLSMVCREIRLLDINNGEIDVEIVALFVANMQAQFLMKMCDIVRKIDTCDSDAQICESCESKEGCPDRKDTQWIQ